MNEDLTNQLLPDASPYISEMIYDEKKGELFIECANNPEEMKPKRRIMFSGITKLEEELNEENNEKDIIDSIIGINWLSKSRLCIQTEKKAIIVELKNEPKSEKIA